MVDVRCTSSSAPKHCKVQSFVLCTEESVSQVFMWWLSSYTTSSSLDLPIVLDSHGNIHLNLEALLLITCQPSQIVQCKKEGEIAEVDLLLALNTQHDDYADNFSQVQSIVERHTSTSEAAGTEKNKRKFRPHNTGGVTARALILRVKLDLQEMAYAKASEKANDNITEKRGASKETFFHSFLLRQYCLPRSSLLFPLLCYRVTRRTTPWNWVWQWTSETILVGKDCTWPNKFFES